MSQHELKYCEILGVKQIKEKERERKQANCRDKSLAAEPLFKIHRRKNSVKNEREKILYIQKEEPTQKCVLQEMPSRDKSVAAMDKRQFLTYCLVVIVVSLLLTSVLLIPAPQHMCISSSTKFYSLFYFLNAPNIRSAKDFTRFKELICE